MTDEEMRREICRIAETLNGEMLRKLCRIAQRAEIENE